jgi:molybdenum cofactor synthesis domain-containing protein
MSNDIHGVVITVSDSAARGVRVDESGPEACRVLRAAGYNVGDAVVVPDSRPFIAARIREAAAQASFVITTGGTGLAPRDVTPEATRDVMDREVPGIAEMLRAEGRASTPSACLSRGTSGLIGRCLVVNLPGSPAAVREGLRALVPVLGHALQVAAGATEHPPNEHPKKT